MSNRRRTLREPRLAGTPATYVLILGGADGRPCVEYYHDAAAYEARLVALQRSAVGSVSIEEIVGWLETL